jgi:hypothetical protein
MRDCHRIVAAFLMTSASFGAAGCFVIADLGRFHEEGSSGEDSGAPDVLMPSVMPSVGPSMDATYEDRSSGADVVSPIIPGPDAAQTQTDAAFGDDASSGGSFYALDDPQRWSFFDVKGAGGSTTYSGVVFDGRYLYFVPDFSPPNVLRYDTQGGFTDPGAWTYFAPMAAIEAAGGASTGTYNYLGGAFDGRYVYLAPFGANAYAVQYDTQKPFSGSGSWSAFQTTSLDSKANYWGVVSDGRYAYFIPNLTTTVLAYDNTAAGASGSGFGVAGSWTSYNLGTGANYGGFWGGVVADKQLYLVPYSGNVASSHNTTLPVSSPSAWNVGTSGFDFSNNEQISPPHFWGAGYDGTHIFFVPYKTQSWTFAAYDTSGNLADDGSWTTCALNAQLFGGTGSAAGFVGGAFDGKRLILAPFGQTMSTDGGVASLPVVAYDTTQPLCPSNVTTAYSQFDPTQLDGGAAAQGFEGAAFDGQYVYLVPHTGSVVARFQARSAKVGLSPSDYRGSWW